MVTTDQGNEFRGLEGALPEPAVHREKLPSDRNATAVIDSRRCPCREARESRGDGSRGRPCRWPSGSCGTSTRDPWHRLDTICGKTAKPKSKQKLQSS